MTSTMIKRSAAWLYAAGGALALQAAAPGREAAAVAPTRSPNIVVILADDLGYGEVGYNGQTIHRTPNIDRLAASGLRFTQHYAGSAVCAPSRCVLMTGRHTGRAQIRDNIAVDGAGREIRPALAADTVTVARRLQAAGYATACVGKWGLGDEGTTGVPWLQGFDYFYGYLHNTHGTRYYTEFIYRNADKIALRGNYGNWRKQYAPDLLLDEALRFMGENRDRPFYLYFTPNLVHGQYVEPPPDPELPPLEQPAGVELTPKERAYTAMVRRLDRDVGRLVQKIDELGLGRDTLVIFTSDNGGRGLEDRNDALFRASGGLRGGKADLYEGGLRVPMVARWTGTIAPGATEHLSGFVDFLATACDLASVPVGGPTEGISYAPLLRGRSQPKHDYLYWELAKRDEPRVVPLQAVRQGVWKLILTHPARHELFHIADDPAESRNLAEVEHDVLARLAALLDRARTNDPLFPFQPGPGFD
jgi:arylsulfatase A-like enzyme